MAEAMSFGRRETVSSWSGASLRAIALPAEHGGWGLLTEPLLLALFVAPSGAGAVLALAIVAGFLWRHPARLVFADYRRGVLYPRTRAAVGVACAYAVLAVVAGFAGVRLSVPSLWPLVLLVAPPAAVYLAFDLRLRSREAVAEAAGALALSGSSAIVAVAAGWPLSRALGLWLLAGGRSLASILEIRCRLRRQRGGLAPRWPVLATHGAVSGGALAAALAGSIPMGAVAVPVVLFARAGWNLRDGAPVHRPQEIGWSEVRAGLLATLAWSVAYRWAA